MLMKKHHWIEKLLLFFRELTVQPDSVRNEIAHACAIQERYELLDDDEKLHFMEVMKGSLKGLDLEAQDFAIIERLFVTDINIDVGYKQRALM